MVGSGNEGGNGNGKWMVDGASKMAGKKNGEDIFGRIWREERS